MPYRFDVCGALSPSWWHCVLHEHGGVVRGPPTITDVVVSEHRLFVTMHSECERPRVHRMGLLPGSHQHILHALRLVGNATIGLTRLVTRIRDGAYTVRVDTASWIRSNIVANTYFNVYVIYVMINMCVCACMRVCVSLTEPFAMHHVQI